MSLAPWPVGENVWNKETQDRVLTRVSERSIHWVTMATETIQTSLRKQTEPTT